MGIFLNEFALYRIEVIKKMDRPTKVVTMGMFTGLLLFIGFELLTIFKITPLGISLNNFFSVVGILIFFITGFFYLSLKTIPKEKQ